MSVIKLGYFDTIRARGEAIKIILAMSGAKYEIVSHTFEEWPTKKAEVPTGQLPYLYTEDGQYLSQSDAICRYLGKRFGFMGNDLMEETLNDVWMGNISDVINDAPNIYGFMLLGKPKPENGDKMIEDFIKKWEKLAALIQKHFKKTGKKFLISDEIQVADIWLLCAIEFISHANPQAAEVNDTIKEFLLRIRSDPRVKKHLDNRPNAKI